MYSKPPCSCSSSRSPASRLSAAPALPAPLATACLSEQVTGVGRISWEWVNAALLSAASSLPAQRVKHVYKLTKLAPGRSAPAAHLAAPPPCSLLPPPCLHHQAELARSHKLARPSLPVFIRSHERQLESVSRLSAVGLFQAGLLLQLIPQPRLPALSAASALPAQPFKPEGVG